MERIKLALEKAKASKQEQVVEKKAADDNATKQQNAEKQAKSGSLSDITYEQTRVIKLDPETLNHNRIVANNSRNPHGSTFDLLRTQVLQIMKENDWKTVAITSPGPEAGKTVVSINLAMSIAKQTEKTAMLVDFDLRRPKVAQYLGIDADIEADTGLEGVLNNKAEIQEVIVNPDIPRLVVLPIKNSLENAAELLSSSKVKNLIQELKGRYKDRIVIFDLPPVLNVDDTIAVLPEIDCVLMVVANGMFTRKEITESMQHLEGLNMAGFVLNKSDEENKHYYYQSKA